MIKDLKVILDLARNYLRGSGIKIALGFVAAFVFHFWVLLLHI